MLAAAAAVDLNVVGGGAGAGAELGSVADRPHLVQSPCAAAVPSWLALGMKPAQHAAADVRN